MLSRIYQASDATLAPEKLRQRQRTLTAPVRGVPVYVMLPLDTVWLVERDDSTQPLLIREKAMEVGLEMLSRAGVDGVMIDVWWGIAEHAGPRRYDFSAYRKLFEQVASKGLKVQAVMSFHAGARGEKAGAGKGRRGAGGGGKGNATAGCGLLLRSQPSHAAVPSLMLSCFVLLQPATTWATAAASACRGGCWRRVSATPTSSLQTPAATATASACQWVAACSQCWRGGRRCRRRRSS